MSWSGSERILGHEAVDLLQQWESEVTGERTRLEESHRESQLRKQTVAKEYESSWDNLTALLVPTLDPVVLDELAARYGLAAVEARQIYRLREDRRQGLQDYIAAIEADASFVNREAQLNEIDIRMHELVELRAPLATSVEPLEADDAFRELIAVSYGLPEYQGRFWHLSYYRHWKEGDRIVEEHGPRHRVSTFEGVRKRHLEERRALEALDGEIGECERRRGAIAKLVKDHARATAGLSNLDTWTLSTARALVREHLDALADETLFGTFAHDPALLLAAKRVRGAAAKARYLESIEREWIGEARADLARRLEKLQAGIVKYGRSKNYHRLFDRAEIEAKYAPRREAWAKRRQRIEDVSQQIVVYQDYATTPVNDFLWWDYMTSHHHHRIHEVDEWHVRHRDDDVAGAYAASYQDRQEGHWDGTQDAS